MSSLILENVYVHFPIFGSQTSLRKALYSRSIGGLIGTEARRKNRIVVKALEAISLELKDGDRLGLVGHNGAGKSTLLRVMAGIYEPISGNVRASGRITPLLEILPALDGEDTGYDNIVSSGLMLGMSNSQIHNCISDIEEFTELGEYLTLPVRTYSAGMLTRLGFALATAIEPDILLIDEGIGAGDQRFAEKAERRLNALVGRSRILVLSSHSDLLVHQFCNKVALLQEGRIISVGPATEIIEQYHNTAASALENSTSEALGIRTQPDDELDVDPDDPDDELDVDPDDPDDELDVDPDDPKDAASSVDETTDLNFAISEALNQLIVLYYSRASKFSVNNNYPEALADLKKILELDPDNVLALLTIGQIQTNTGFHDSAIESFQKILHVKPDLDGAITGIIGAYYLQAKEFEAKAEYHTAIQKLETCLTYVPGDGSPNHTLRPHVLAVMHLIAEIESKYGSTASALEYNQRILEIDPSNQAARTGLEKLTDDLEAKN